MPKLKSFRVQRFKRIDDASFELGEVSVLVGGNNSGKSSLIQAVHFGIGILQTIRLGGTWGERSEHVSLSLNPNQLIYCPSDNVYALGPHGQLQESADRAMTLTFTMETGEVFKVLVRKGRNRNILVAIDNARAAYGCSDLVQPFSVFSPGLAGISKKENFVSDGVLMRTLARGDANLVLRNILLRLWNTDLWLKLIEDLHYVFPNIELRVSFQPATDEFIDVDLRVAGTGHSRVPLEIAGTGMLQAIQILSYIHRFAPSIIVLDEPDSHLHPNNQRLLCALLRKVSEEREMQVLLTTHSRHVVDSIGSSSGFLWVRDGKVDVASSDDEIGILMEIGALDVKERVASPETKVIVLTEDELTQGLEAVLGASGFNMEQTVVLKYFGVTQIKQLRPLIRVIQQANPGARIVLHRDRDFLTPAEAQAWETSVRNLNVEPFLTDGRDIESHFLNEGFLARANDVEELEMQELMREAFEQRLEGRLADYVNGRLDILRKNSQPGNAGQLAAEGNRELAHAGNRYLGKPEIKKLRDLFRGRFARNLVILRGDPALRHDGLSTFAARAFRATT